MDLNKIFDFFKKQQPKLERFAILDFDPIAKRKGFTGEKWLQFILYERTPEGLQAVKLYPFSPPIQAYLQRRKIPIFKVPRIPNLPLEASDMGKFDVLTAGTVRIDKPIILEA